MPLARRFLCIFSFLLTLCVVSSPSNAQDSDVLLLADTITLTPEGNLVAEGQVEIFHEGQELRTSKLIYMRDSETIFFPEGAHLLDENGDSFIASSGELSRDLSKGIVKGAKSVINQQLEMQSEELDRENRIATQFRGVRATACTSCTQTTPIWQIRASSGFHDREKQQIFFNTVDPTDFTNSRLLAAGWLSNNSNMYTIITIFVFVLLGLFTHLSLKSGRKKP